MEKTYDLTNGSVPKLILRFFFPILFTNLLQQVYSMADTVIVGKGLGDRALGAVGNLSSLTLLIIGFCTGMMGGFSIVIAQRYGSGDRCALRQSIALTVKLSAVLCILLTLVGILFLRPVLLLIRTGEEILDDSLLYGYIILGGLTATAAYNLCTSILRALGDSRTPFHAIIISSAVNILLDCFLIFGLGTGVEGAAAATVFSQALSALICYRKLHRIDLIRLRREDFRSDAATYRDLLKNSLPTAYMNSLIAVGCMIVQGFINNLGVVYTSAYSACSRYLNLFILPGITVGSALLTFTSQNYGAKKPERIREGMRFGAMLSILFYLLSLAAIYPFAETLAGAILNEAETIRLTSGYLRVIAASLFLVNFLFLLRNCVQGMGHPLIPMCSGIAEMVLRIPIMMYFLPRTGFSAAAWAEVAAWTGSLLLNGIALRFYIRHLSSERKNM